MIASGYARISQSVAYFSSRQLQVAASELMRFQMGVCLLRLVITNDTGGRSNWGCQATSRAFEAFVRDAFAGFQDPVLDKIPLAAPHPLDRSFQALFGRTIREVYSQMETEKKCLELLENLARERFQSQYQKIEQADVVLFQGEGSVGPAWTFENLRVFALPVLAARRLGKPVFALNQTIYAANASDAKVLRSIFSGFSMVCVREARSYDFARSIGIDNALLCPDFAFGVPVNTRKYRVNLPNRYFCVTGSAAAHAFDNDRYAALIKLLSATFKAKPVFMHSRRKDRLEMAEVLKTFNSDEFIEFSSEDYPDSIQLRDLLEMRSLQSAEGITLELWRWDWVRQRYSFQVTLSNQRGSVQCLSSTSMSFRRRISPQLWQDCKHSSKTEVKRARSFWLRSTLRSTNSRQCLNTWQMQQDA